MSRHTYQAVHSCPARAHSTYRKCVCHRHADHRGSQNAPKSLFFQHPASVPTRSYDSLVDGGPVLAPKLLSHQRKAGAHMWTAPCLQEPAQSFDRIACSHMSGLLMRSPLTAGRDGFRDASSEHGSGTGIPLGTTDCLAFWIDRSHHLLVLEQAAAQRRRPVASRRSGYAALSVPAATAWAGL